MNTNYIFLLQQAIYKSGKLEIQFCQMKEILDNYYGEHHKIKYPTVNEFLTACQEYVGHDENYIILGNRNSKNPILFYKYNINTINGQHIIVKSIKSSS